MNSVAVITVARHRRDHLTRQRRWLRRHAPGTPHVVIDMGGTPIEPDSATLIVDLPVAPGEPLPLATARNLGARRCDADVLVFLDVDCLPCPTTVPTYLHRVSRFGGVWSGPVGYLPPLDEIDIDDVDSLVRLSTFHDGRPRIGQAPQPAPSPDLFWSLSFAVRSSDFATIGGFDEEFVGYGGEDTDFGRSVEAAGLRLWFGGDALALHQHHPISSPPIEHFSDVVENAMRFHGKWGAWPMEGWLGAFADLGLIDWTPRSTEIVVRRFPSPTGESASESIGGSPNDEE